MEERKIESIEGWFVLAVVFVGFVNIETEAEPCSPRKPARIRTRSEAS